MNIIIEILRMMMVMMIMLLNNQDKTNDNRCNDKVITFMTITMDDSNHETDEIDNDHVNGNRDHIKEKIDGNIFIVNFKRESYDRDMMTLGTHRFGSPIKVGDEPVAAHQLHRLRTALVADPHLAQVENNTKTAN